jgi:hypothetical protein
VASRVSAYAAEASSSIARSLRRAAVIRPVLPHSLHAGSSPPQRGQLVRRAYSALSDQSCSGHTAASNIVKGSSPSVTSRRAASPRFIRSLSYACGTEQMTRGKLKTCAVDAECQHKEEPRQTPLCRGSGRAVEEEPHPDCNADSMTLLAGGVAEAPAKPSSAGSVCGVPAALPPWVTAALTPRDLRSTLEFVASATYYCGKDVPRGARGETGCGDHLWQLALRCWP